VAGRVGRVEVRHAGKERHGRVVGSQEGQQCPWHVRSAGRFTRLGRCI
jgi:hypothetical protein